MQNILIFDEQGYFYGSTQKLFRQMAKILAKELNVFFAGGPISDQSLKKEIEDSNVKILEFCFTKKQNHEPHKLIGMKPTIIELIEQNKIECVFTTAYAHYQFPINTIPAGIPIILISPFGHYCTNGNVFKTYVSGKENASRIKHRGVKNVQVFFNPLEDFSPNVLNRREVNDKVVFGRIGRGEDSIFDPIAVKAFKKLEDLYPDKVKYIIINPPPAWKTMAEQLNIKNMEFRGPITDRNVLESFYNEIDVLAHARKDGETVGMAIAEAMMSGCPILTHKSHFHNDHFEILNDSYSKFAEVDDSEKYFENMKWMVEHKDQIRPMGQLARARALEVFGLESQTKKIITDFKEACKHCYHYSKNGKTKGYANLYVENLKNMPFLIGKTVTYWFPGIYKFLRKFYKA